MSIQIIPNQPVMFALVGEEENNCPDCADKSFCQIVNPADATQYQVKSTNVVINGNFDGSLDPWISTLGISIIASITNESGEGTCDGEAIITASNYTGNTSFSLNAGAFVLSPGGTITYSSLCSGCNVATVIDEEGIEASVEFCIGENIACGDYKTTDSLLPFTTNQLLNCLTSDFI